MFRSIWNAFKEVFTAPTIRAQFEELLLQEDISQNEAVEREAARLREEAEQAKRDEEAKKQAKAKALAEQMAAREAAIKAAEVKAIEKEAKKVLPEPVTNTQITDAVTQAAPEVKPKRARTTKGTLVADNPTTPNVNEAWVGGKAPAKTAKKTKASKKKRKLNKPA